MNNCDGDGSRYPDIRGSRTLFLFMAVVAAMMAPVDLSADWRDFIPRAYENGAEMRIFASYEREDQQVDSFQVKWDDSFLREKFTLYSKGYSYHPRFIQYFLSLTGSLKQEHYSSTFIESTGWQHDTGIEYNARLFVLPEHDYSLEVFTQRFEPLFKEHSATQHDNVETSKGVRFQYRKKPYFFNSKYLDDEIRSAFNTTDVTTFSAGGGYFKDWGNSRIFSVSASYNHPSFENTNRLEGDSNEAYFSSLIRNRRFSLNSNVSKTDLDQRSPFSGNLESDQFSLLELFTAYLPYGFMSEAHYRYQTNTNIIDRLNAPPDSRESSRKEIQASLSHKLYDSLDSRYTFRRDSSEYTGGESNSMSHYLNFDYSKRTRWGHLLAGIQLGRTENDSEGVTSVANESHPSISVPGSFTLNEVQLVDPESIELFLRSPLPPNELILLQLNVHYIISPVTNTFRIDLLTLPAEFVVPGSYDFVVSYLLRRGQFELQTDTFGYRISYDLYYTLQPYFSYAEANPEVVSGFFPGLLFDSSTTTAGLLFHKGGFRLVGEYQELDWDVSPFTAYRLEARYTGSLNPTTQINAAAEYLNKYFPEGSALERDEAYTEERTSVSGTIQKQLFRRALLLSGGGSYSRYLGLTEGDAYSLNSTLSWRIAKLDFTLGATLFHSDTQGIGTILQERTHQYYYLSVGRKLF